jgi:penicillin-insensitive murein endopeptidase
VRSVYAVLLAGCAELGTISDGTSISIGKPNNGALLNGARLPDHGDGYTTREIWLRRDCRYGTDELIDMVTGVARRLAKRVHDVKLVVADLSSKRGGGAFDFHRSHQSGRDVDLVYYMRGPDGLAFEPDGMRVFDARGRARDMSGVRIDVPRTWELVKELLTAPEATVQYIFMYEPIVQLLLDHAKQQGEPDAVLARARKALRQPGDSARHDDHMHVRVYCSYTDRDYGCIDIGPMDLLAEREAERAQLVEVIAQSLISTPPPAAPADSPNVTSDQPAGGALRSLLRARADRIGIRR